MRGGCSNAAKWEGCISLPSMDRRTACMPRAACAAAYVLAAPLAPPAKAPSASVLLPLLPPLLLLLLLSLLPGSASKSWPTRAVKPPRRESWGSREGRVNN